MSSRGIRRSEEAAGRPRASASLEDGVYAHQLDRLGLRRSDIAFHAILALAAVVALGGLFPLWVSVGWLAALAAVLLLRDQVQRAYARAGGAGGDVRRWGRRFTLGAFGTGLAWSALAGIFLVSRQITDELVAVALIGGMSIAGVARNAASTSMMLAFEAPLLGASIAALLARPDPFHLTLALVLAAFALVLTTTGRSLHQSVASDLALTFELVKSGASVGSGRARTALWEWDGARRQASWSPEMYALLGSAPEGGGSLDSLLKAAHPEDRAALEAAIGAWLEGRAALDIEHRIVTGEGPVRWLAQVGLAQPPARGSTLRHTAFVHDISERKAAEARLQFANVVMRTQIEASQDGILVIDRDRRIISANERLARLFDYPNARLEPDDLPRLIDHLQGSGARSAARILSGAADLARPAEHDEVALDDGRTLQAYSTPLSDTAGANLGRAWFLRDISDQKRALAQVLETSRLDPLTGLANRAGFIDALAAACRRARGGGPGFAVLCLDLDNFKDINDALGHPAGDDLLRAVAARLRSTVRINDVVARFGGDEFAVLAFGAADIGAAQRLAQDLLTALARPHTVRALPIRCTASIGIAMCGSDAPEPDALISRADLALYAAKAGGRSAAHAFTGAMDIEVRERVALGAALHEAIEQDQLFLLYQPQIDLASDRIVGVEALVRWRHPVRGVLGPGQFIPIAEQAGMIDPLGRWVLARACREARAWADAGLRLAVNVSPLQFKTGLAFEAALDAALASSGLPPRRLELELTETVLMNAYREHAALFERLRARGVAIAIDDFGTGYSSLAYLSRFPVDRIKIAQEFVREMERESGDAAIVRATIGLARELNIEVIAEGVERAAQMHLLRSGGCHEAQGYLFSRPVAPERIDRILADGVDLVSEGLATAGADAA